MVVDRGTRAHPWRTAACAALFAALLCSTRSASAQPPTPCEDPSACDTPTATPVGTAMAVTDTPTPTATPSDRCLQHCSPDSPIMPVFVIAPDPIHAGDTVTLDASASTGAILEHLWRQHLEEPRVVLTRCFPGLCGCDAPQAAAFVAPEVLEPTTLTFDLILTSSDGAPSACRVVALTVLPAVDTPTPTESPVAATPSPQSSETATPSQPTPTPDTHTPAATNTPTETPTCVPTSGSAHYCAAECPPCPTVRAGCPSEVCVDCAVQPSCGPGEVNDCTAGNPSGSCCTCATPTPPPATVTPGGPPCVGDCNNDGRVTIDELITGVDVALRGVAPDACPALDRDRDGRIDIGELIAAVGNALNGCPGA